MVFKGEVQKELVSNGLRIRLHISLYMSILVRGKGKGGERMCRAYPLQSIEEGKYTVRCASGFLIGVYPAPHLQICFSLSGRT
jgi:hypothetical protein